VIGFSSFGVLLYYAVANASAWTQDPAYRRWPRWLNVVGGAACIALVAALPLADIVAGVVVIAVGVAGRAALRRRRPR
jgi:APA family basic amino acid/polyamine antiporter